MNIFSLTFIFIFLPIAMIAFYSTPNKYKTYSLSIISLIYYYLAVPNNILMHDGQINLPNNLLKFYNNPILAPTYLKLIVILVLFNYFLALFMNYTNHKNKHKIMLFIGVVVNLYIAGISILMYDKRILGLTVVSLTGLGYIIDVFKKEIKPEYKFSRYFAYSMFFPRLYVGPLVSYGDMQKQFINMRPSLTGISNGIVMLISGMAKKIIIADGMTAIYNELKAIPISDFSVLTAWILMVSYAFSLYFLLSAYCDVARGLGLLFSLKLPKAFHYPFQARSIDEFFARFNITINEFVRKYVYVQLGEKKNGTISGMLNILLVSMLISMWYGIKLNSLVWGIYLAVFIILEQYVYGKYWKKIPPFLARVLSFCITMMSFSILQGESLNETLTYLSIMFGLSGTPITDINTLYIIYSNYALLILGFIMCSSIGYFIARYMSNKFPVLWEVCTAFYNISLVLLLSGFILT